MLSAEEITWMLGLSNEPQARADCGAAFFDMGVRANEIRPLKIGTSTASKWSLIFVIAV